MACNRIYSSAILRAMCSVRKACQVVGSQRRLAELLEVTPATINQWVSGKRPIPMDRCVDIERVTDRKVTCEELRPDLVAHWRYVRGTCANAENTPCQTAQGQQAAIQ